MTYTKAEHDAIVARRNRPLTQQAIGTAKRPNANTGGTGDST